MTYEGDFRLLNPFPVLRDEDGEYHCPMPMLAREFHDDDTVTTTRALCGEPLGVEWTLHCPVPDHDGAESVITPESVGKWAVWSAWKLACAYGHVVMTSADGVFTEDPQPFDSRQVFGPWEATA